MRALVIAAAAVAGCATAPVAHDVQRTARMSATVDATWQALVDVIAERNWPVKQLDRSSGLAMIDWMAAPEYTADCGSVPLASEGPIRARFSARIRAAGSGSEIEINATFQRTREIAGSVAVIECTSKGALEVAIQEMTANHVRPPDP
ncbi:MAG TPA: hypothetical protein VFQ42_22320 [Mycobacterium sp.]|nr:hypothetical protein [Mycobacterium sp.]